jgi:predicted nuclease of restriction endonuclease-like (RecB) superfamily
MNFQILQKQIQFTHHQLYLSTIKSVNTHLSLRNWLIGYYIIEFEQKGKDKAKYGTNLIKELSKNIKIKGLGETNLKQCRKFFMIYPEISQSLTDLFKNEDINLKSTLNQIATNTTFTNKNQLLEKKRNFLTLDCNYYSQIIKNISFTHFVELFKIEDEIKRKFYELLILKTYPSVEELKNKIAILTYERIELTQNSEQTFKELENKIIPTNASDAVKSIYFFDFLDLPNEHLLQENKLEESLITHLEKFIIELGNGFCFEGRQKRILIDGEYYFVDLVFYHRILKCHILIELKTDKFKHEHLSQLNSYVACYKDQITTHDDNPPIGILLCTEKGEQMVKYALAGMEENLFVSKYLLNLPNQKTLTAFIETELKKFIKQK